MPGARSMRRHLLAVALTASASLSAVGCGGSNAHSTHSSTTPASATLTATSPSRPSRPVHHGPPPGSLPQTDKLPSADTPGFHAEMAALWRGVQTNSLRPAMQAFFPEGAYAQVKAIADPRADFANRLVHNYRLDIGAANALLGAGASNAQLVRVEVRRDYAHWVDPGACFNRIGYYEVPNARVVYREGGAIHSFGIASMISWRGVWYVVHLGAVEPAGGQGVVDDPSTGPGTSAPSSTC